MTTAKRFVYAALPPLIVALALVVLYARFGERFVAPAEGRELNRLAWERTFAERGLPVPPAGPREGYWGSRLPPKVRDPVTAWREDLSRIGGMLEVDERGLQTFVSSAPGKRRVLVVGGSVAFGAYASGIERTYFHRLGRRLEASATPADVTVCAAGAWKSSQELAALREHIGALRPDVVVLLDGLNDLTSGATAEALFGDEVPTPEGVRWSVHYHEHDYDRRVTDYLENTRAAVELAAAHDARVLLVLQPSLAERATLTATERHLLAASLEPHESRAALTRSYEAMRAGLRRLAERPGVDFLDLSRAFDGESATTFTDLWHFSDPGHEILAERLASGIAEILR